MPKSQKCGKLISCNKYIVTWSELENSSHINPYLCAHFLLEENKMPEKYFQILMKLCHKAIKHKEVPIAAIIVHENKIIAKAYNTRKSKNNPLNHAEMLVIKKASQKLKSWRLNNCDLYVTLKPCSMCESTIKQARLSNVYYLLEKPENKKEYYKTNFSQANIRTQSEEYSQYLTDFFKNLRDKA